MEKSHKCILCSSEKFIQRQGHARDNENLVPLECKDCGLVALSRQDHIDEDFYKDGHMRDFVACDPKLELAQSEEDSARRCEQFLPYIKNKNILDIGCGAGGFLLKTRNYAKKCIGIEIDYTFKQHYIENELSVFESLVDLPDDFAPDVIFLFHVFEHIASPQEFLQELHSFCSKFNHAIQIIIEVPHANDALLTYFESEAFSKFTYWSCHLYLYTANTLQAMLEKSNFCTEKVIYFQRYPLANHLYWLAQGKPGGQHQYTIFNDKLIADTYEKILEKQKLTDTIIGFFTAND